MAFFKSVFFVLARRWDASLPLLFCSIRIKLYRPREIRE